MKRKQEEKSELQLVLTNLQQKLEKKQKQKQVPAFLLKLSMMLDKETVIQWSEDGLSFKVLNEVEFCRNVLPKYFKHNNFTSFIRQLNMYGFHKLPSLHNNHVVEQPANADIGSLNTEALMEKSKSLNYSLDSTTKNPSTDEPATNSTDAKIVNPSPSYVPEVMEFKHEFFNKYIQDYDKVTRRKQDDQSYNLKEILVELSLIKQHQQDIQSEITNIKKENQKVWLTTKTIMQEYESQKETIDKILGFLAQVFSKKDLEGIKAESLDVGTLDALVNKKQKLLLHNDPPIEPQLMPSTATQLYTSPFAQPYENIQQDIDILHDRIYDITNNISNLEGNGELDFNDFFDVDSK